MISLSPALQVNWDWRAAGNFVCGGTGAGMLATAACGGWLGTLQFEAATGAALAAIGIGLFLVWLEIGRPWRFANVFRNPATSWMSREAWAAVVLFPAGALGAILGSPPVISIAAVAGLFFLVCQAQMLQAAKGIPAWRDASVVPLIVATGLTEGAAALLIAATALGTVPQWLLMAVFVLITSRTIVMLVYAYRLRGDKLPLAARGQLRAVTMTVIVAGGAIPLALLIAPLPGIAAALGGLLAASAGWWFKYTLVCRLAFTQGFEIEHTPARGPVPGGPGIRPGWTS